MEWKKIQYRNVALKVARLSFIYIGTSSNSRRQKKTQNQVSERRPYSSRLTFQPEGVSLAYVKEIVQQTRK